MFELLGAFAEEPRDDARRAHRSHGRKCATRLGKAQPYANSCRKSATRASKLAPADRELRSPRARRVSGDAVRLTAIADPRRWRRRPLAVPTWPRASIGIAEGLVNYMLIAGALLLPVCSRAATLCPDGSYVGGDSCQLAPDGSYVSGSHGAQPRLAPDGRYVGGHGPVTLCPDGSYVNGQCHL